MKNKLPTQKIPLASISYDRKDDHAGAYKALITYYNQLGYPFGFKHCWSVSAPIFVEQQNKYVLLMHVHVDIMKFIKGCAKTPALFNNCKNYLEISHPQYLSLFAALCQDFRLKVGKAKWKQLLLKSQPLTF